MFETLPGFREFYPEDYAVRSFIFGQWRRLARAFGFSEYEPPVLEPLELITAKSGDEIVSQLFNFEDKGERAVTLRPELTPSMARMVGARANSLKRPVRWYAIGENFRYEKPQKGRLRSHFQLNADLLGEPGPAADAEVIALLVQTLQSFGLGAGDFAIRLSDRTLWMAYLESLGLEEAARVHVLGVIDKLERLEPEAVVKQLAPHFSEDAAADFLARVTELTSIRDLDTLERFFSAHASVEHVSQRLEAWRRLLGLLDAFGVSELIRIDLGIVRGLAYYTGFVFEAFQTVGKGRALAGGGRYDHLVEKLGGPSLPAVGFGMGDVTLRDLLEEKKLLPPLLEVADVFVIAADEATRTAALRDVMLLRSAGYRTLYALKPTGFSKQLKQADQAGARLALIYGEEELQAGTVKVRHLAARRESAFPRARLLEAVAQVLEEGLPEASE
ncbi:MAG: histidine--tRNA ligase [Opitutales bacterium]